MKTPDQPLAVYLKDYIPPHYAAREVALTIDLDPDASLIRSRVIYEHHKGAPEVLHLSGRDLELLECKINGHVRPLSELDYSSEHLELRDLGVSCEVELLTRIHPRQNTALEGLYLSHDKFFTQCEPEGFRRMTYYLDRPDVMASFTTTIRAKPSDYPVLLSNGNLIDQGKLEDGRHFAVWHDPFPKPSYLFALVAGDLSRVSDQFVTRSGRTIALHIYVEQENLKKCSFAMEAIKQAMRWDEEVYGLEYDLDLFMVVAVSDFNMGAMENKGLNIFNSKYVLASPETATDTDFENIRGVVGHEYFHNWTGNRVTLRDWFQLSLKEGLTVFRDQEFSGQLGSTAVKRIQDVRTLREQQFAEDAGPMAHPVRPESYIEINNFYTPTVYHKGAEVIRMLHSLVGSERYFKGMQEYFRRFDGKAIVIEDFLGVMQEVSGRNLSVFKRWYEQAGTPRVRVQSRYDAKQKTLTLDLEQKLPDTSGQSSKKAQLIPVRTALIGKSGRALTSKLKGYSNHEHLLELDLMAQSYVFEGVEEDAIPSVFRQFSAPVIVDQPLTRQDRFILLAHDTDSFNLYEAAQTLAYEVMLERWQSQTEKVDASYKEAFRRLLTSPSRDPRLIALAMLPPTTDFLVQRVKEADVTALFQARQWLMQELAKHCEAELLDVYRRHHDVGSLTINSEAIGRRELKNSCLYLLSQLGQARTVELAREQYRSARNMTDAVAALGAIAHLEVPEREECLQHFYTRWRKDALVVDKWFTLQASSHHPKVLEHVKALLQHADFDILNPNRVYSIFRHFTRSNPYGFHHLSGEGYAIVADYALRIDRKNPQVAAMLSSFLSRYRMFDKTRQSLMRKQLERMMAEELSRDVYEVVSKSLQQA